MKIEKFLYLAGIIAAHDERTVVGRTRLQKTVKLLQQTGLPTDYDFVLFFYGPYSEGVRSDLGLLEVLDLVKETEGQTYCGYPRYVISANDEVQLPALEPFIAQIKLMEKTDAVALELAATYDMFRELGSEHENAMTRLYRKKGDKCTPQHVKDALNLLGNLGLPNN